VTDTTTTTQTDAAAALEEVVATATLLSEQEDQYQGQVSGYERGYASFVTQFATATDAGASETEIREGIQSAAAQADSADGKGVKPIVKSADAVQNISVLAALSVKDGDLPAGYVWRPDVTGPVALLDGETSLATLVRGVRNPSAKDDLTKEQRKALCGKPVALRIIEDAASKIEAIEALEAQGRLIVKTAKENKKAAAGPKKADAYAKALRGPAEAILGALDDELLDDPALVRDTLAEVKANVEKALAHASLAV
jgi:hypothetical protein